jgi:hypothetical protein
MSIVAKEVVRCESYHLRQIYFLIVLNMDEDIILAYTALKANMNERNFEAFTSAFQSFIGTPLNGEHEREINADHVESFLAAKAEVPTVKAAVQEAVPTVQAEVQEAVPTVQAEVQEAVPSFNFVSHLNPLQPTNPVSNVNLTDNIARIPNALANENLVVVRRPRLHEKGSWLFDLDVHKPKSVLKALKHKND